MVEQGDVSDAAKQMRVISWLDGVREARARLADIRDKLREMDEGADGLSCAKVRKDGVRISYTPDKIGSMIAEREEVAAKLNAEAEFAEGRLRDACRTLQTAWDRNAGTDDPAFAYLLHRYVDGMSQADAAREVGTTIWGAKLYPRRVAALVYDSDPERFPPTVDERFAEHGFGYWNFAG